MNILHPERGNRSSEKLCAGFEPRIKYAIHYMCLVLYLKLGLRLTRVHRVLAFKQKAFFKPYTDHCTAKRAASTSPFEIRLWKLMINATYGKTIQNVRGLLDSKFCLTRKQVAKWVGNPRFLSLKIISEKLVVVFLSRTTITLNKPYPCGFTILERAKYFMYQAYYECLKPKLGKCHVVMSDTDSLMIFVRNSKKTDNIKKISSVIDFSNYPPSHELYSLKNKNKLGFFKDELAGDEMEKFCGLRSKTYAFLLSDEEKTKSILHSKAKGVTKAYKKKISFANYKKCILSYDAVSIDQFHIRAKSHNVYTTKISRLAFSSYDDKRWIFNCAVHSVPYGSVLINKQSELCPLCKIHNPLPDKFKM